MFACNTTCHYLTETDFLINKRPLSVVANNEFMNGIRVKDSTQEINWCFSVFDKSTRVRYFQDSTAYVLDGDLLRFESMIIVNDSSSITIHHKVFKGNIKLSDFKEWLITNNFCYHIKSKGMDDILYIDILNKCKIYFFFIGKSLSKIKYGDLIL